MNDYFVTNSNLYNGFSDASGMDESKKLMAAQLLRQKEQEQIQEAENKRRLDTERQFQQHDQERVMRDQIAESQRKAEEDTRRQQAELAQMQQPQSSSQPGGMGQFSGMFQKMMGGGAGGTSAGGASASNGLAGSSGAVDSFAGAGGSSAGGGMGSLSAAGPWAALAAAVLSHNEWAKKKDMHDNQDALLGRALYKDADWYQPRFNERVDGWGDEVKLASLGSSPVDLFKASTWSDAAEEAAKGGILGATLRRWF